MTAEQVINKIIKERGIKLTHVSEKTGVPYSRLQPCLKGKRELKADEWIKLCVYFDLDPRNSLKGGDG